MAAAAAAQTTNTSSSESGKEALEANAISCRSASGATTPPAQARPDEPPPRVRRQVRNRRRRRRRRRQMQLVQASGGDCTAAIRPRLQSISQNDNQMLSSDEDAMSGVGTTTSAPQSLASPLQLQLQPPTPRPPRSGSNSAVRVLFRDHQQQQVIGGQCSSGGTSHGHHSGQITGNTCNEVESSIEGDPGPPFALSLSVAEANRRLIERQIEAMRAADSRRWNFDFANCAPMNQPGHRYVDCAIGTFNQHNMSIDYPNIDDNNNHTSAVIRGTNPAPHEPNTGSNISTTTTTNTTSTSTTQTTRPRPPRRNAWPLNDKNQTQNN